jgi:hypothetical protein
MATLVSANVGTFYHGFTKGICIHYFIVTPTIKGVESLLPSLWALETNTPSSTADDAVTCNPSHSVGFYHYHV